MPIDMVRERCPRVSRSWDAFIDITGEDCLLRDCPPLRSPPVPGELVPCDPFGEKGPLCSLTSTLLFAMTMLIVDAGRKAECLLPA